MLFIEGQHFRRQPGPLDTPCKIWVRAINSDGYGSAWIEGHGCSAHRAAWQEVNGRVPDGLYVLHRCDVPACVNVDHLFIGTALDNVADMISKGRKVVSPGEANGRARVTEADVIAIRSAAKSGESTSSIARRYEIARTTAHYIISGRNWPQVEAAA